MLKKEIQTKIGSNEPDSILRVKSNNMIILNSYHSFSQQICTAISANKIDRAAPIELTLQWEKEIINNKHNK